MPKIDESDQDVGNEPPFVARKVVIKKGQSPKLDYTFSDELGRGRFGTVLKCTEKKSGLELAAKFVSTRHKEERENVEREVDIMRSLQHRRLLQLYDVYDDGAQEMCIITELINGGELFERVIDDDFELTEKVCTIFMRQICEGVQYMHGKMIMHLDMKPENILCVTRTGNRIKLIDFGLARRHDPNHELQVMFGTPDFAAPEVLSYESVTPAADMWSLGVVCYVLLSGLSPFMGNSDLETMTNVTRAQYDFNDESFEPISDEAKDFIAKLLIKDPRKRFKPSECLAHKWLARATKAAKTTQLSKTKLKKFVVRRRWQKAVTAIMALTRMGANLSLGSSFKPPAPPKTGSARAARGQLASPAVKPANSAASSSTTSTSNSATRHSSSAAVASSRTSNVLTTSSSARSPLLTTSTRGASSTSRFSSSTSSGAGATTTLSSKTSSSSSSSYRVTSSTGRRL